MNGVNFASLIRKRTNTDTTTLSDADIVLLANAVKPELTQRVVDEVDEDYFGMIATTNLIANQREYTFPQEMFLKMKYLEAKFDPNISDERAWIHLKEFDITSYKRSTDEQYILATFANSKDRAFYDIYRGSLFIYSGAIVNVTDGLKLYYIGDAADLTTAMLSSTDDLSIDPSSTSHGMPKALHELWARRIQIEFKSSAEQPMPLTEKELSWKADLDMAIDKMKGANLDRSFSVDVPRGSTVSNDGYDL